MATNEILPFCPTDTGTNLLTESEYTASADRTSGNKPGIASSKLNNKALRQASFIASQIAQYVSDKTGVDVLDNGVSATLLAQLKATLLPKVPVIQRFTAGSGTYNQSYVFTITSGSATVGATYTHNAITYTVVATVASSLNVIMTGSTAPLASGTLTKASGTGDSTITFQAFQAPIYLKVKMSGGGGSGQPGNANSSGAVGNVGSSSTFGSSLLTAAGGSAGASGGGAGGAATVNSPALSLVALSGGAGEQSPLQASVSASFTAYILGGKGGANAFSGAGVGGSNNGTLAGTSAATNSGAGGGGGGTPVGSANDNNYGGGGGGAGAYLEALIASPSATYAWAVGAGGALKTGTTNGGAGAAGIIIVEEHYQ